MNAVQWSLGIEPQFNYGHDLIGGPHSAEPDKVMTVIWRSHESRKLFHMTVASDFAEKICLVYTKHIYLVDCHMTVICFFFWHKILMTVIWHLVKRYDILMTDIVIWQSYDSHMTKTGGFVKGVGFPDDKVLFGSSEEAQCCGGAKFKHCKPPPAQQSLWKAILIFALAC